MLNTGYTVPPKIWMFVEQMLYVRMPFLTPTLPMLEPIRVVLNIFLYKKSIYKEECVSIVADLDIVRELLSRSVLVYEYCDIVSCNSTTYMY